MPILWLLVGSFFEVIGLLVLSMIVILIFCLFTKDKFHITYFFKKNALILLGSYFLVSILIGCITLWAPINWDLDVIKGGVGIVFLVLIARFYDKSDK